MKKFFILLLFLLLNPYPVFAERIQGIPPELLKRAEDYIISKVTKAYFEENYRLIHTESHCNEYEEIKSIQCSLYFDYLPLSQLSGQQVKIFIQMFSRPDYMPSQYVANLDSSGKVVEPEITKEQALKILAEKTNVTASETVSTRIIVPSWSNKLKNFSWEILLPLPDSSPHCGTIQTFHIDTVTGALSDKGRMTYCE